VARRRVKNNSAERLVGGGGQGRKGKVKVREKDTTTPQRDGQTTDDNTTTQRHTR